ncbi:MAG: amylo-alpha-1,6-glucosidase [Candidatus Woesearchaeota archaeon]
MEWYIAGNRIENANPDRIMIMRKGATFSIPLKESSRYDGLTFYKNKGVNVYPVKIMDRIDIEEHSPIVQTHIRPTEAIIVYESGLIIRYSVKCATSRNKSVNSLVIHANRSFTGTIWLDTRHPYDIGAFHKNYNISEYHDQKRKKRYSKCQSYNIDFTKRGEETDVYDLDTHYKIMFESAQDDAQVERIEWWHEFKDGHDERRGETIKSHYGYAPFRFISQHRIIIAEDHPESFIESAPDEDNMQNSINDLSGMLISMLGHHIKSVTLESGMKKKYYTMMAGIPWFFQSWSRDTGISLHGLRLAGLIEEYKEIISSLLRHTDRDTMSIPEGILRSIDAPLIAIMRLDEAYDSFSQTERKSLRTIAGRIIRRLESDHTREGLVWSETLETWMDTGDNEFRRGACIEIQALMHRAYSFMEKTEKKETVKAKYRKKKDALKKKVGKKFINNGIISDHITIDNSPAKDITPNVFLAYYYSPRLLEKKEWEDAFDNTIEDIYNKDVKGLFASISPKSELFESYHTGINNKSYHRGDSWYYINSIAAISLLDLNRKKYRDIAREIYDAAIIDLSEQGTIGYCSEITSFKVQEPRGCWAQSWSAAMLLELHAKIDFSD